MTNAEKYKTAKERRKAYYKYLSADSPVTDEFLWLELEAEEELKPCPFCGGEAKTISSGVVRCSCCGSQTRVFTSINVAIPTWNRRAK